MSDYSIKSIREEFKAQGIFYTPPELAETLKSMLPEGITEIYDPTCGDGGLLSVFGDNVAKYGQEINETQLCRAMARLQNFKGVCGDTLKQPAFAGKKFKAIIANPPFSIAWDHPITEGLFADPRFGVAPVLPPKGKADYAFLLHIIHYLADDGVAVTINFPGILYRGNREYELRKWFIDNNFIDKVILIPGDTFVDTAIATVVVVMRKNRESGAGVHIEDKGKGKSREVLVEEIKRNDYNLSVSSYIFDDVIKETVDPFALQGMARRAFCSKMKADIEMDKMVCDLEGYDFNLYLDELITIIRAYYEPREITGATA